MKMYNLIFSSRRLYRMERHFLFWLVIYLYHIIRVSFLYPSGKIWSAIPLIMCGSFTWGVCTNMFISYTVVYYLVPKFFQKKKYLLFIIGIVSVLIISFGILYVLFLFNSLNIKAVGSTQQHPLIFLKGSVIRLLGNPPFICALLLSLKAVKNWHLKQIENETLTKEKASAELQLLKAQIHPHFLFNTLNNIYAFTLTKSPVAAELVQKLSHMLNYMITDCEQLMVPLEKEIHLLEDYIDLEKIRYGERLQIEMNVTGDSKNQIIAPLLMIPFVENCFKHGSSKMRGRPWIKLNIAIIDNQISLSLSNSKPGECLQTSKKGIGLANVKKRLELLYPSAHLLDIKSGNDIFSVELRIKLLKKNVTSLTGMKKNPETQTIVYA